VNLKRRVALLESSARGKAAFSAVWLDHIHVDGEIVATRVNGNRVDRRPGENVEQLEARVMAMLSVPTDTLVMRLEWVKPGDVLPPKCPASAPNGKRVSSH
jgi:hypothetical protein